MYAGGVTAEPSDRAAFVKKQRERAQQLLASDHFVALGVARAANPTEVQRAFVEAVKTWHPDRVPAGLEELASLYAQVFGRLDAARATLTDATRKQRYIEELTTPAKRASASDLSAAEAGLELKKAEVLLKKNDLAQAEHHLRRAVQLAPANVTAQTLLVWVQVKPTTTPEELKRRVGELDRLIAVDATVERAFFFRAQLRKRLGLEKEAYADFVKASELDKNNIDAQREIRLYKMRQEKAPESGANQKDAGEGVGGFFKKLFKR